MATNFIQYLHKYCRQAVIVGLVAGLAISCSKGEPSETAPAAKPVLPVGAYAQATDSLANLYHFNGVVAFGYGDSLLFTKSYGLENFQTKKKLSQHSSFAIGSVSKQFTAVLILRLADQGKLKPSDEVSKFLGNKYLEYGQVTIHQMLTHTSGIHDGSQKIHTIPGLTYFYSNTGYYLLQQIIEKVSGKSYTEVLTQLTQEYDLPEIRTVENLQTSDFSSAWIGNASSAEQVKDMPKRLAEPQISIGAGGVVATAPALVRWNNLLYTGKLLRPKTMRQFLQIYQHTNHYLVDKIGYGYGLMYNLASPASFFHSGYVKGSPSLNVYYPKTGISLVILSNLADEAKGKDYVFRFHDALFEKVDSLQHQKK